MWKTYQYLSQTDLERLNTFFAAEHLIDPQIPVVGIHGFLAAVLTNPHALPPHVWMPVLFNKKAVSRSPTLMRSIFRLLLRFYRQIEQEFQTSEDFSLLVSVDHPQLKPSQVPEKNIILWCHGYLAGMQLDSDAWRTHQDALALTFPIGVLVGDVVLEQALDAEGIPINTRKLKNKSQQLLPVYVQRLFTYWKTHPLLEPKTASGKRKCPCGSGKPFIYCCGHDTRILH
jgi:yecA family protein